MRPDVLKVEGGIKGLWNSVKGQQEALNNNASMLVGEGGGALKGDVQARRRVKWRRRDVKGRWEGVEG